MFYYALGPERRKREILRVVATSSSLSVNHL